MLNKLETEKLFYKEKNYSGIKQQLINCNEAWSFNILGKIELQNINPDEAFEYFNKAKNVLACAYCKFLTGEISEAKVILVMLNNTSPAANWLLSLISVLENNTEYQPTYFQIRNFYEQDLEMLFLYKQNSTIEKIINKLYYFENFNKEIYKYTSRVLFNNGYIKQAEVLIKKSLSLWYKDPETHFILGEIYSKEKKLKEAKKSYLKAIEVNCGYEPASIKLNDFSN